MFPLELCRSFAIITGIEGEPMNCRRDGHYRLLNSLWASATRYAVEVGIWYTFVGPKCWWGLYMWLGSANVLLVLISIEIVSCFSHRQQSEQYRPSLLQLIGRSCVVDPWSREFCNIWMIFSSHFWKRVIFQVETAVSICIFFNLIIIDWIFFVVATFECLYSQTSIVYRPTHWHSE